MFPKKKLGIKLSCKTQKKKKDMAEIQINDFFTNKQLPFVDFTLKQEIENENKEEICFCCNDPSFNRKNSPEKVGKEVCRECIHDILDPRMVINLTQNEKRDASTIPVFGKYTDFLPDEFIIWHKREYLKNLYMIQKGTLPFETTDINQLSDIQVLLLLRGTAYSETNRSLWNQKLRPRFASIDAMLLLEYF